MDLRLLFLCIFLFCISKVQNQLIPKQGIRTLCPHLYQKVFQGYVPQGNLSAGVYVEVKDAPKLKNCVVQCCVQPKCNVAFMTDGKCYHVSCKSDELCLPVMSPNADSVERISMVLVQPTDEDTWEDVLQQREYSNDNLGREMYSFINDPRKLEEAYKDLLMDESTFPYSTPSCNIDLENMCMVNEECVQNTPKSRIGSCRCKEGFVRSLEGECVPSIDNDAFTDRITTFGNTSAITKKQLTVSVESKVVQLPDSEVTLVASVTPPSGSEEEKYQFEWTSLQQPEGSTAVKQQNGDGEQLQLSKLTEGLYTFKVTVSNSLAYGEAFANVSVRPPSRTNQPPQVIITPANQTVKLPNTGAVLDASSSTDDDGIVSWHWELQQGPLGYQPQLQDSPTLQLNDLSRPGNYTFKLTVTDTDKATSVGMANITVLKITDYPPEANAGEDKIIYLPHNALTLNGNLSSDDHAITTWEWTKSPGDADKAVDMQDTRTPYLQLSNLEEGMYTFTLKVTDSANQSSTAEVHVFVKPPTNQPPVANGGGNITISLPQTWVELDASSSTDDNKIVEYKWELVDGSSNVNIQFFNESKTNITGLTKGNYKFKVTVTDDNGNTASDLVYVTVNQNKNQKPTANAGGNFEVDLPRNVIILNGSRSSDDWAITRWKWTRNEASLAVGNIAEKSDESPVLVLTDVTVGKYIFNLTVYDEQGLSDTDTATITVNNDPKLYYLVEITIDADVKSLTEAQYSNLKGKLALLMKDGMQLQVRGVKPQVATDKSVISFYVEAHDGKPEPANEVVSYLRQKLKVDASLLGFSVASLNTAICQNNCSGHGICDELTRECICEAFWMKNQFKALFDNADSDCSWNVLYVTLGAACVVLPVVVVLAVLIHTCVSCCLKRRSVSKPTTYKLLEDTDDLPPYASRKNLSDSDTDSDVVFESRAKNRFTSDSRNGHKPSRNGFTKNGRRVKT